MKIVNNKKNEIFQFSCFIFKKMLEGALIWGVVDSGDSGNAVNIFLKAAKRGTYGLNHFRQGEKSYAHIKAMPA